MPVRINEFDQPIGPEVPCWRARPRPRPAPMQGRLCRIEPLDPARHGAALHRAFNAPGSEGLWTYMAAGPFEQERDYLAWLEEVCADPGMVFHAIIDAATGRALGQAAYLRINPDHGVIEVGHIALSPPLQRTAMATEAMYLMLARVFDDLGYRRLEWKCDALNARSCRAAERLGFRHEGVFRQALIYKGRNRDTAWFSVLDREWPALKRAYQAWLSPENFDAEGQHRARLGDLIAAERAAVPEA